MDWFMPRDGRMNPDGTPHRLSTMFYTREIPMLQKHIEEKDAVLGGVADMLKSKLVTTPLTEIYNNRDHFGTEIWSPENPYYKQGMQFMSYLFLNQSIPISATGISQSLKTGGGLDEVTLALLGFGPAPAYAEKTPIQNYITGLFQRYVAPETRPAELGEKSNQLRDIRNELLMAQNSKDREGVELATQKWFRAGGGTHGLTNVLNRNPSDVIMFRALGQPQQEAVMALGDPLDDPFGFLGIRPQTDQNQIDLENKSAISRPLTPDEQQSMLQRMLGTSFHFWRSGRSVATLNERAEKLLAEVAAASDDAVRFKLSVGTYGDVAHWLRTGLIDVGVVTPGLFVEMAHGAAARAVTEYHRGYRACSD